MRKIKQIRPAEARVILTQCQGGFYVGGDSTVAGPFDSADSARFYACVALADRARVVVFVNEHGRRV